MEAPNKATYKTQYKALTGGPFMGVPLCGFL